MYENMWACNGLDVKGATGEMNKGSCTSSGMFLSVLNVSGNLEDIWGNGSSCMVKDIYFMPKVEFYIAWHHDIRHN